MSDSVKNLELLLESNKNQIEKSLIINDCASVQNADCLAYDHAPSTGACELHWDKYISNQHDVLRDTAMGAVLKQVRLMELRPLLDEPPEKAIASDIRRQVKPFGIEIDKFTFVDLGKNRTLRIITHTYAPPSHFGTVALISGPTSKVGWVSNSSATCRT